MPNYMLKEMQMLPNFIIITIPRKRCCRGQRAEAIP
jgi:hypothetical protein